MSMIRDRDEAIRVGLETLDKRLDGMNEFRESLRDQSRNFITRDEHAVLERSIKRIEEAQANMQGRYAMAAMMFSLIVILIDGILQWGLRR